uniref:C2H2-type domain-containing protein n=1 Tax=Catharus ustulatus TaxID=91951 RepID=A0A8C3VC11_CATUS
MTLQSPQEVFYWVLMIDAFFSRGLPPPQQQQMLSLRATNQPSLLNANPMLQRALLMQQMQGTVVMGNAYLLELFNHPLGLKPYHAPALQQFFPQATRHSLLGPPPVGVSLKPARLGFPSLPFQRQNRTFRKVGLWFPAAGELCAPFTAALECIYLKGFFRSISLKVIATEKILAKCFAVPKQFVFPKQLAPAMDTLPLWAVLPLFSIRLIFVLVDFVKSTILVLSKPFSASIIKTSFVSWKWFLGIELKFDSLFRQVLSSGGSLKVTIQQSSESRAISTTALKPGHWACDVGTADPNPESVLKFYCYICKTNCCSQQNFQSHMAGIQHQQRLGEIQHMSNVCFVSLLPMVKQQKVLAGKDGYKPPLQRWCNTCQVHFTGDLIKHRRTQEHKLAKRSLRPFCTVCSRHFKTPRKFVEHMKSPEHKQKAKEVMLPGRRAVQELITVDAVGCFEDDDEEEDEEEGGAGEEEDRLDFLVPVAGYLCRLCHKFYHSDSAARLAHCKSLMHFENFQAPTSTLSSACTHNLLPKTTVLPYHLFKECFEKNSNTHTQTHTPNLPKLQVFF